MRPQKEDAMQCRKCSIVGTNDPFKGAHSPLCSNQEPTKNTRELYQPAVVGEKPCPGEAHSNAYIDNCGTCLLHRWGFVPDTTFDLDAAKAVGAVRCSDVPDELWEAAERAAKGRVPVVLARKGKATVLCEIFVF